MMPSKVLENALLLGAIPAPFLLVWVLVKLTGPIDLKILLVIMSLPLIMVFMAGMIYYSRQEYNYRNKHR